MPPLIGWAAASGRLSTEAWILYVMLFLWQFPHFMPIAWMYCEGYDRAGYFVLPQSQARDRFVVLQTILPLLVLLPVSVLPAATNQPRILYCTGALLLSSGFFYCGHDSCFTDPPRLRVDCLVHRSFTFHHYSH